jgi:hypothetical protein
MNMTTFQPEFKKISKVALTGQNHFRWLVNRSHHDKYNNLKYYDGY